VEERKEREREKEKNLSREKRQPPPSSLSFLFLCGELKERSNVEMSFLTFSFFLLLLPRVCACVLILDYLLTYVMMESGKKEKRRGKIFLFLSFSSFSPKNSSLFVFFRFFFPKKAKPFPLSRPCFTYEDTLFLFITRLSGRALTFSRAPPKR